MTHTPLFLFVFALGPCVNSTPLEYLFVVFMPVFLVSLFLDYIIINIRCILAHKASCASLTKKYAARNIQFVFLATFPLCRTVENVLLIRFETPGASSRSFFQEKDQFAIVRFSPNSITSMWESRFPCKLEASALELKDVSKRIERQD
jgi:hypothetical protein